MSRPRKLILFAVGRLFGILVVVAVAWLLILGANAKRHVQTLVSDAIGMEVKARGRRDIGFFPSLHITMEDVQIRNRGSNVASVAQATLETELLPLLQNEVRMDSVRLKHVRLSIERQRDGTFNFETRTEIKGSSPFTGIAKVSISDATLLYADQQSGKGIEADSCDLDMHAGPFINRVNELCVIDQPTLG